MTIAIQKHTCNDGQGPAFGRKTPGCPRCDELVAGAPARRWATKKAEARFVMHDCKARRCGPVCTFGDW